MEMPCMEVVFKAVKNTFALLLGFLEHRRLPIILAIIAFVSMLGTLQKGFGPIDDLRLRAKLLDKSQLPERLLDTGIIPENNGKLTTVLASLQSSVRTEEELKKMTDYGTCAWWTYQGVRFSNWRPLEHLTYWLDYQLYPNSPALMRAHSLVWFALLIFLVSLLYRKFLPVGVTAGLAAVLYFLDNSNYLPAMWIANRNLLIAVTFSVLCILCHHKWRNGGSIGIAVISFICLIASLLATEAGIATFAFLFSYALFIDNSKWGKRLLSLVPAILIIVAWRIIYNSLGHGGYGGGFIIDPVREFGRFANAIYIRGVVLLASQWAGSPPEILSLYHDAMTMKVWFIAAGFLVLVLMAIWPLLYKDRLARFWFTAMVLCVLPICATMPMNRNLLFVGIAAFGLMSQFIVSMLVAKDSVFQKIGRGTSAWVLLGFLFIAHILVAGGGRVMASETNLTFVEHFKSSMDIGNLEGVEQQDLIIVNYPNPFTIFYIPTYMAYNQWPLPRSLRVLSPGFIGIEVTRTDEKTVTLRALTDSLMSSAKRSRWDRVFLYDHFSRGYRDRRFGYSVGQKVQVPRMSVEILSVNHEQLPTKVSYQFEVSADDSSLRWLMWDKSKTGYSDFKVPAIGESVIVPGPFHH